MADFVRADRRGSPLERVDISGAEFRTVDLANTRFRDVTGSVAGTTHSPLPRGGRAAMAPGGVVLSEIDDLGRTRSSTYRLSR